MKSATKHQNFHGHSSIVSKSMNSDKKDDEVDRPNERDELNENVFDIVVKKTLIAGL